MRNIKLIFALFSSFFIFAILLNSVGTVILQSIKSFGISKESASILEGFKDLPIALTSFLVASSLPRLGYKRAMIIASCLAGSACIVMALLPHFTTTKFLFFVVGVTYALVKISVYSTIGLLTEKPNQHASLLNTVEGFFMIGVLSGYWIFSFFIDSGNPASLSWVNVYWVLAVMCAINIMLLLSTSFPEYAKDQGGTSLVANFIDMIALAWKPLAAIYLISAFLYVLIEQGIGTWLPTFNNEVLHLPEAMSIQATSIFAASLAIGRLSAGVIFRYVDWYWVINICVLAMGALVLLTLPMTINAKEITNVTWASAPIAAFIFPLIGLFMAPIYPAITSVILSALPKSRHAAMTGLILVFAALGGTTGSLITGLAFAKFDGQTAFYLSLVPMIIILFTIFWLRRLSQTAN